MAKKKSPVTRVTLPCGCVWAYHHAWGGPWMCEDTEKCTYFQDEPIDMGYFNNPGWPYELDPGIVQAAQAMAYMGVGR